VLASFSLCGSARAQETNCPYDEASLSFKGAAVEQAECLLRPVLIGGHLGPPLKKLPAPLNKLVGQRVELAIGTLQKYLKSHNIAETDLGGSLSDTLSHAGSDSTMVYAHYFVIHDVSTPNYLDAAFPTDINEASWEWNDLRKRWSKTKVAHVFVSRTGESITAVDFGSTLAPGRFGTKFARDRLKEAAKGLQLHIEMIQPRRGDPTRPPKNDAIAPQPGFTEAQLDRLALLYIAASVRRGEWLIPAFHAAVDAGIPDAHDDPQNFDLKLWADRLAITLKNLAKEKERGKSSHTPSRR
jgi:hypothetical protein